ncbi:MAG: zinc-ribbon domain-containing protein [Candidatus Heimdallarchaeota archaeon]|nr:MAG: zinc-ribbon domain-containing protein [Candidatus Heimdallarchaeota archaeon]
MAKFCSKCGNQVVEDSLFCKYCGNKLKPPTFRKRGDTTRRTYSHDSAPSSYPTYYRPPRSSSSRGLTWFFVGIFFIVVMVSAVFVLLGIIFLPISLTQIMDDYDYVGDKTFSIDDFGNDTLSYVEVEIHNSLGSVNIEITNSIESIEARALVYAREGHSLHDATTFEVNSDDYVHYIFFDSISGSYWESPYLYELEILISSRVITALDVEISTGSISVIAQNSKISLLSLDSSTGSITVDLQEVVMETGNPFIHTSTGSITTTLTNLEYPLSDVEWTIDTSTGSIDLSIFQESVLNNTWIKYYTDTSTGSINFKYQLDSAVGLLMYADVSTGTIYTPGYSTDDRYSYKSEDYDLASMKFYLSMHTSTGSITINSLS